jgi:hypothetical protein
MKRGNRGMSVTFVHGCNLGPKQCSLVWVFIKRFHGFTSDSMLCEHCGRWINFLKVSKFGEVIWRALKQRV